jgi:hypothetical protein
MNLPYKTLEQLDDAGIPTRPGFFERDPESYGKYYAVKWATEDGHLYCGGNEPHLREPSLEELIDACGEGLETLARQDDEQDRWVAMAPNWENLPVCAGPTPKSAVAALIIALRKQ